MALHNMSQHSARHHRSIYGRSLFALLQLFFGYFVVKPRENSGVDVIRAVLLSGKIREDRITPSLCEVLRNEAYRRASSVSHPLLWRKYLPALYEVGYSAADYLQGHEIADARVTQILDLETGRLAQPDTSPSLPKSDTATSSRTE